MLEHQWITCTDPMRMLRFLQEGGKASERKLRLFAVACCRFVWHKLPDEPSRKAVEVAEQYADGRATANVVEDAWYSAFFEALRWWQVSAGAMAINAASRPFKWPVTLGLRMRDQVAILRDIVGPLPFQSPLIEPKWLLWNDATVRRLAEAIYEERSLPDGLLDATGMGVLADALEDAGCAEPVLLEHLRGPGPHVRGCFVIDLLTGRK